MGVVADERVKVAPVVVIPHEPDRPVALVAQGARSPAVALVGDEIENHAAAEGLGMLPYHDHVSNRKGPGRRHRTKPPWPERRTSPYRLSTVESETPGSHPLNRATAPIRLGGAG
jgi:hypothetical protein